MDRLEADLYRENIKIASIVSRIGAYIIDTILITLIITIFFSDNQKNSIINAQNAIKQAYNADYTKIELSSTPDNTAMLENLRINTKEALDILLLYMGICIGLQIIYNFILIYKYGATFGQIILKIRVVDSNNFDKPTLHVCMKRAIAKCFLGTILYIGFILAFVDRYYRTIHDKMSNTIVIVA